MRATTRTTRSSRRPLIAALALVLGGTLLTPPVPEAHAEESVRSAVRAIVAERLEGISREQCREACRRTGALRLRGRHRLAGHVFAESLHVEPGADVVIEAGATIFVTGDITIDAPVTTAPAPVTEDPKAFLIGPPDDQVPPPGAILGANGTNNVDIVFICDQGGDVFTSEPLLGGDGGAGGSLHLANAPDGAGGSGGRGGKGVGFVIDCADGTVTVGHNIVPGRGGAGGSVTIVGSNGTPGTSQDGASVTACGGRGGDSGDVRIVCGTIVFLTDDQDAAIGRIGIRAAGVGGAADATGGDGADMISCDDDGGPGNGGKGLAVGGAGGTSTLGVIEADRIVPDRFDARDIISFEDVTEFPDGGAAVGAGGDGGDAAD